MGANSELVDHHVPMWWRTTEWFGCFGICAWGYGLIYPFDPLVSSNPVYLPILVMLLLASMVATVLGSEHDVAQLSRLAWVVTPLAAVLTAIMSFLPEWPNMVAYAIVALCLGPPFVRRLLGVAQAFGGVGKPMSVLVVPAVFVFHAIWADLPVSGHVRYMILAVIGFAALWRIRRVPTVPPDVVRPGSVWTRRTILVVTLYLVVAVATDFGYHVVLTVAAAAWDGTYPLSRMVAVAVGGLIAYVSAVVTDLRVARPWLIIGLAVVIAGLVLALSPGIAGIEPILLLTFAVGSGVTLFLLFRLRPPVVLLGRETMLFSALGVAYVAVRVAGLEVLSRWLPIGRPWAEVLPGWFFAVLLILTVLLFVVSVRLLNDRDARGLVEAMVTTLAVSPKDVAGRPLESIASELDQVDRRIIGLLVEGHGVPEIARIEAMSVDEIEGRITAIRTAWADPVAKQRAEALAGVVRRHGLTAREAEILGDICAGKTNSEIARERFITDRTVKFHVGNVLAKLHVTNRREARDLVARAEAEHEAPA